MGGKKEQEAAVGRAQEGEERVSSDEPSWTGREGFRESLFGP